MAITYSAGPGTIITTYAMNETLGAQTQQTGNNTVVVSNTIAAVGNGQIGTKYTGYVNRLIVINLAGTQQTRMCTTETAGTGTTRILTVHENWTTNPVLNDTIHVFYDIDDCETGGAGGGVTLSAKTGLYEFTNKLTVGAGTNSAGLQNVGTGMEISDGGNAYTVIVVNNGRLDFGYVSSGNYIQGGIATGVNNAAAESIIQFQSGSKGYIQDALFWSQLAFSLNFNHANGAGVRFYNTKILKMTREATLLDAYIRNLSLTGLGNAAEYVRLDSGSDVDGITLINTGGLHSASADTTTESITVKNPVFVGNVTPLTVNSNKTWYIIDPSWSVTAYTGLTWLTGTANYVYDQRSINVTVQTSAGTALNNVVVVMYEGTVTQNLVTELTTNSSGIAAGAFTYKLYATNSTTTTYGAHAFRVDLWDYYPFIASQTSTEKRTGVVVLNPDPNVEAVSQASALSAGSSITWNRDTNPSSIIDFTGGSGTLSVGNTVTASPSGATGIVTKIVDGNSTAGTVHLKTRNATAFATGDSLANGSGWTASYTTASVQNFTIWIDGSSTSMQVTHDYLAALTADSTSATGELIHEWGRQYQARALYKGGSGFYTERSNTWGVFITNFGVGTISYFTDDAGTTWTPPTSVTLEVNGVKTGAEPTRYVQCYIEAATGGPESVGTSLMNTQAQTSYGSEGFYKATASYNYTTNQPVIIKAREAGWLPFSTTGIITSSGLTVTAIWQIDPNYNL